MELGTTRFLNVRGRAEFLTRIEERMNCRDIEGEILTDEERFAYAICEELDHMHKRIESLELKLR